MGDRSGSVPNIEGWVRKNLSYLSKQFIMEDWTCFWVKGKNGATEESHDERSKIYLNIPPVIIRL